MYGCMMMCMICDVMYVCVDVTCVYMWVNVHVMCACMCVN